MTLKIDFVIPWVDGADPEWQKEKQKYDKNKNVDNRNIRYRDLDNLVYWFRGVEKFAPWVNKIHFITWGHVPSWLNKNHPKINVVRHEDYIPGKYLPTFSTRPIELNLHRIAGLSEHFVYFNDDMFIIKPMKKNDFFKQGLPKDTGVLMPMISLFRNSTMPNVATVMEIINTTYSKQEMLKKNLFKWINPLYGKFLIRTLTMLPYKQFSGFLNLHIPNSYLKSTFQNMWDDEYTVLDTTCKNKFRTAKDVNQQLPKYKQLVEGTFKPRSPFIGKTFNFTNKNDDIVKCLKEQKYKMICINDNGSDKVEKFDEQTKVIQNAFNTILPNKSKYEL